MCSRHKDYWRFNRTEERRRRADKWYHVKCKPLIGNKKALEGRLTKHHQFRLKLIKLTKEDKVK